MRISVLGPLSLDNGSTPPSPRDRVVVQVLAVRSGEVVRSDQIADVLWPDAAPTSWNKVVQGCVSRLRRSLGSDAIETAPGGYRLATSAEEIDAAEFERLVHRGRELMTLGEPERADRAARDALALWRGQPFVDLEDWDPARIERERLNELRLDAEELALDAALRSGRHREVLAEAHARAEQQPVREMRWALLARAQYQAGRQTEALRTLRRARELLATEVGLEPGRELAALEHSILEQDPALDVDRGSDVAETQVCPFPGLLPYDVDHSESFFGRDGVIAECLQLIEEHGVVAVVGPSGSGKSSVLRAGLAARQLRSGRAVHITSPGSRPVDAAHEIERCTADVLVVDQLEEAATGRELDDVGILFEAIVRFSHRGKVAVAVRADQVGLVTDHPPLARLLERGMYLLAPMTESELRSAIERPAAESGLLLEAGLVDLLIREVEWDPGALPLMGHALQRTWERREGRVLTVSGYRETGGLRGAIAQTAESLYATLPSDEQDVVRDLMLRMVVPDREGAPMRCSVPRRMVSDGPHQLVIDRLVEARLVTSDDTSVDLAHEALARAWPRMQTWLDDDVEGQRILRHLTMAADSWLALGRPESELYRGVRLRAALEWRERAQPDLAPIEHDFLEASEREHRRIGADAEAQANEQARRNRQLRTALITASVLLVFAVIASVWATRSAGRANDVAAASTRARAGTLADLSASLIDDDRSRALLVAVEANRMDDSPTTRGAMLDASFERALTRTSISTPATSYWALDVDDAGTVAVAKRPDGQLDVIDLETRTVRHAGLPSAAAPVGGIDVHPDGSLAASSGGNTVVVYGLDDGLEVASFQTGTDFTWVRFSPNGTQLAISEAGGTVVVVDTSTWAETVTLDTETDDVVSALAFGSPDDEAATLLVTTACLCPEPGQLHAFDLASGHRLAGPVDTGENLISSVVATGDGQLALVGQRIERRTVDDLELVGEPFGFMREDGLVTLAVLNDGRLLAGGPVDLKVFEPAPDEGPPAPPTVIEHGAPGLAVVPATGDLVTGDIDGMVSTWTVTPRDAPGVPLANAGMGQVATAPDGTTLAIWDRNSGVQIIDGTTLERRAELDLLPTIDLLGIDLSDDRVVTLTCPPNPTSPGRCAAVIDLWDSTTGQHLAGPEPVGEVWSGLRTGVAFAGAARRIAVGDTTAVVNMWDAATLDPVGDGLGMNEHTASFSEQVWAVTASDVDGASLLVAQDQLGQSVVWDITDLGSPLVVGALENALRMGFLTDGTLVTASGPGSLTLRDPFSLTPLADPLPTRMPADTYHSSDDGVLVASGDHGVQLWDLATGELLAGPIPAVRSTITADGTTLHLGAGAGGTLGVEARSVSLRRDDLVAEACRRAGRNLTHEEWHSLIGSEAPYRQTCEEWPPAQQNEPR